MLGGVSFHFDYDQPRKLVGESTKVDRAILGVETFLIPSPNFEAFYAGINKLARKAQKLGTGNIGFTTHGDLERVYDDGSVEVYSIISVTGNTPRVNGWAFVATLEHLGEDGTIVRTVPGTVADGELAGYRNAKPLCEHCGLVRNRIDTFVLRRDEDGLLKQVGRNCLADFLGGVSPESLASQAQWLAEARSLAEASEGGYGSGRPETFTVESFLYQVAAFIKLNGWKSRGAARIDGGVATADYITHLCNQYCSTDPKSDNYCHIGATRKSEEFKAAINAPERQAEVEGTLAYVATFGEKDSPSDYEWNVYVACKGSTMTNRQAGLVASAVAAYQKHLGQLAEQRVRKERAKSQRHIGQEGVRGTFELTVAGEPREIDGNFGVTYLYTFIDAEGNTAKWFASAGTHSFKDGETVLVDATVKRHDIYREEPQTVLTRVSPHVEKPKKRLSKAG